MVELYEHQEDVLHKMHNGCVLWGDVGGGKSIVSVAYFIQRVCGGTEPDSRVLRAPRDIYIITTAKKRDSLDWVEEAAKYAIGTDREKSISGVQLTIDSWNNIGKYENVKDAFFVFDEQRTVGSGTWANKFIKIARANEWILLSATPGDTWLDYATLFIANGWYKNRTEFKRRHVEYAPYVKFPKVLRYHDTSRLVKLRNYVLVEMPFQRHTTRHNETVPVSYDQELLMKVVKERWHVYENRPLKDVSELYSVLKKVVFTDATRLAAVEALLQTHPRLIVFYNSNAELELLRTLAPTSSPSTTGTGTGTRSHSPTRSTTASSNLSPTSASESTEQLSQTTPARTSEDSSTALKNDTPTSALECESSDSVTSKLNPPGSTTASQEATGPSTPSTKTSAASAPLSGPGTSQVRGLEHLEALEDPKRLQTASSSKTSTTTNPGASSKTGATDFSSPTDTPLGGSTEMISSMTPSGESTVLDDPLSGTIWEQGWSEEEANLMAGLSPGKTSHDSSTTSASEAGSESSLKNGSTTFDSSVESDTSTSGSSTIETTLSIANTVAVAEWNDPETRSEACLIESEEDDRPLSSSSSQNGSLEKKPSSATGSTTTGSTSYGSEERTGQNEEHSSRLSTGDPKSVKERPSGTSLETSISSPRFAVAEWNGHKHQPIPKTDSWVYLVQYRAGSEGWNCIDTDAMCFFSLTYSYKDWHQAHGRIDRINTPFRDLWFFKLVAGTFLEQMIWQAISEKRDFNEVDSISAILNGLEKRGI